MQKWPEFGRLGQLRLLLREDKRDPGERQQLLLLVLLDKVLGIEDG